MSKREKTCDCTIFLNFGLPCRHIFLCREKQNHDIYDEVLIPNRRRKEFEPAHDDTEIHIVHVNRNQYAQKSKNQPQNHNW